MKELTKFKSGEEGDRHDETHQKQSRSPSPAPPPFRVPRANSGRRRHMDGGRWNYLSHRRIKRDDPALI